MDSFGLDPDAVDAYRLLLSRSSTTEAELVDALGCTVARGRELLAELEGRALVSRRLDSDTSYVASRPSLALGAALAEQRRGVRGAEELLEELDRTYASTSRGVDLADAVDLVVGAPAMRAHLIQLQSAAREEVLSLVKAPVAVLGSEANTAEDEAVARGVRYRAVLETAMLEEEPRLREAIAGARERGEEVRLAQRVPLKLFVVDREVALVPLGRDPDAVEGALVVRGVGLLDALVALFDHVWDGALEVAADPTSTGPAPALPPADDLEILGLLMAGLTDEATAKALGTSTRTVQRRVRALMDRAGVRTRLQLGWAAAERGWLRR